MPPVERETGISNRRFFFGFLLSPERGPAMARSDRNEEVRGPPVGSQRPTHQDSRESCEAAEPR